jgi:thioredoxin-disulfide reductase
MNLIYDTIIIGAGPAGYTAGIYAARREMKTLIIGKNPGGQIMWAREIENIPGFKSIQSYDFINKLQEQVNNLHVEIKYQEVLSIIKDEDLFIVKSEDSEYSSKSIIIAVGQSPKTLGVLRETEFVGKGVAYCANCDAPFFKNKTVIVAGGGNSALDAAEYLSKIASKVYLINNNGEFNGFESLIKAVKSANNIEIIFGTEIIELLGENKLNAVKLKNLKTNETKELKTDGLFVEIGKTPKPDLVAGFVDIDDKNQIKIDNKCRTSFPGIFAAGDITDVPYKQISIACGQGTIAALAAYQFLQSKNS